MYKKPLGHKSYGHIAHLPGSRLGPGDHKCTEGQAIIATEKARDKYDTIIVQEKLDGSNVGIAMIEGVILPLTRSGHLANSSRWEQHHHFNNWVYKHQDRFLAALQEGERICGEWLQLAHGTRYDLPHEPFVPFDIMIGHKRKLFTEVRERLTDFTLPRLIHRGTPFSIENVIEAINISGHGAIDPVEGAVWRVERTKEFGFGESKTVVDFLVKYVRPDKVDGCYLSSVTGKENIWNTYKE